MSDVFFSYANGDRERIIPIVRALESTGWSIFWDMVIPAGKTWRQVIGTEIKNCRCVVVAWSKTSIESDWVQEEAEEAKRKHILVPVMIDRVTPPFGFGEIQVVDFSNWNGDAASPLLEAMENALSLLLGPAPARHGANANGQSARDQRRIEEERKRAIEEENARTVEDQRRRNKEAKLALKEKRALEEELKDERERRRLAEAKARDLEREAEQEQRRTSSLEEILPGSWQAEIAAPIGLMLRATFQFNPNRTFEGQIVSPVMGATAVQGQWNASNNELTLGGQQMVLFVTTPYAAGIRFSAIQPRELRGISGIGEQVTFRKTSES